MFTKIMVPVDLAHTEELSKALAVAADLSKHYTAPITYVGVTSTAPSAVAHDPEEFKQRLRDFAAEQSAATNLVIDAKAATSTDPAIDLDEVLRDQIERFRFDLVIMASHVPQFSDYILGSHGGELATHAKVSVLIVR